MDRRSLLDKKVRPGTLHCSTVHRTKVAVLPLLCAAALLLATFWTHPGDPSRLRLNSSVTSKL